MRDHDVLRKAGESLLRGGVVRIGRVRHAYLSARTCRGAGEGFRGHRGEVEVFGATHARGVVAAVGT